MDGTNDIEVFLFTSDGGRSWLPVHGRSHAGVNMYSEEHVRPHQEKGGCVSLTLVAPTAVSLLPVTTAMLPLTTYLQENKPLGLLQDAQDFLSTGTNKLQPVRQVLEAQPLRLTGQHGVDDGTPHDLEAVIVISKAVPRPNEVRVAFPSMALCHTSLTGRMCCPPGNIDEVWLCRVTMAALL